jgi:peptide/nickel transport system substrate-binding protein
MCFRSINGLKILLWLVLLLLLLSGGCGGGGSSSDAKILTVATADDVRTVDPSLAFDEWSTAIVHACTRRLVDYDLSGNLIPDLAEKWDVADDLKTYTFRLRPDGQFADGSPIEARHFKAAIERVRDPATGSQGMPFFTSIRQLEAPDARTLVVHLSAPDPTLPNVMGMTFAAPFHPAAGPARSAASGPYAVDRFEPGVQVVLKRNPHDKGNTSGLEQITVQLRVDESLQFTRLQNGEVDLLPAIPAQFYTQVMADPAQRDNTAQAVVNQTWYFGMNVTRPPWNNPKVRRAALLSLSRARHVQLQGGGQLANGILPPHVPGYDPERTLPDQNVEEAKNLLASAGYPQGVPTGQKTTLWLAQTAQNQRHAEALQSDLRAVGIHVDLRAIPLSEFLSEYKTRADCWYNGWYPDFPDPGNFLEPVFHGRNIAPAGSKTPGSNATRYNNPKVNSLLDRARMMRPGPDRVALYQQAEEILLQDLPWIPLYFKAETRYFRDGVTGVVVHPVSRQMLTGISKR